MSDTNDSMPKKIIIESDQEDRVSNHDELSMSQELLDESEVDNINLNQFNNENPPEANDNISKDSKKTKENLKNKRYRHHFINILLPAFFSNFFRLKFKSQLYFRCQQKSRDHSIRRIQHSDFHFRDHRHEPVKIHFSSVGIVHFRRQQFPY